MLQQAIVDREEQGETLSRLLPSGLADKLRQEQREIGETERVVVTVLMSDIRSYSTIAERADPSQLAGQLNTHRAAMNHAILGEGGTVMQFRRGRGHGGVRRAVPADRPRGPRGGASSAMHELQAGINARWAADGLPAFGSGLGCPPAWPRRPCSAPRSGWSTRWSATPSTSASGCSSSRARARPWRPKPRWKR
jgi:hypothetical protein